MYFAQWMWPMDPGILTHFQEGWEISLLECCEVVQSRLTLCDPMDCSPPGSSVHGAFQARMLEGLPFPTPGDLPDPGVEPMSLASPALAGEHSLPLRHL